ncbi:hypothetical protein C8F04DRAFT_1158980 [Mycena alexandri]|uniref:Uncharacterized protein n=1 Tax=Mycena alexandri TaxID=1745969 RepID=A0AAD6WLH6_9AGAR|nr:hypothetical protein C8F04DRAFT_1158980 [Mycena alexandri]
MKDVVTSDLFDFDYSSSVINVSLQLVLYGIYIVLFILAIYTLARRKSAGKKLLLGYTWTMAFFGTVQLVFCLIQVMIGARFVEVLLKQDVTRNSPSQPELTKLAPLSRSLNTARQMVFAGNNLVTDTLLLYRCFVIWNSDWRPVVLPGVLMACTFALGCASALIGPVPSFVPYVVAAFTNFIVVGLIAGRIWWIRRDTRVVGGNGLRKRYNTAIEMILESGVLYLVVAVLLAIFSQSEIAINILQPIAIHIVNIAPTLIVVRVGLGHNIQDTGETKSVNEARSTHPQR